MKPLAWISVILAVILALMAVRIYKEKDTSLDIDENIRYEHNEKKGWIEHFIIHTELGTEKINE